MPSILVTLAMTCKSLSTINLLICFFAFFFSACSFDNDQDFLYDHKASAILNDQNQLFLYKKNQAFKLLREPVNAITQHDNFIAYIDTQQRTQFFYYPVNEKTTDATLSYPFTIYKQWEQYLCYAGTDFVELSHIYKKKTETVRLPHKAKYIFLNQGRGWFVGDTMVWAYDLASAAQLFSLPLQQPFAFADFNKNYQLFVYTQDTAGLHQYIFDTNALTGTYKGKVNYQKIQHSKALRRTYETEYLQDVQMQNNSLNISGFTETVDSYHMDFQQSRLFFTRNDSLFVLHLLSNEKQFLHFPFGKIMHAEHLYYIK